jgi:hypothetical protein
LTALRTIAATLAILCAINGATAETLETSRYALAERIKQKLPDGRVVVVEVEENHLICERLAHEDRSPIPEAKRKVGDMWSEPVCIRSRSQWDIDR